MSSFWRVWIGVLLCTCAPARAQQLARDKPVPRIALLSPSSETNSYWPQVFRILEEVAHDLGFAFVPYSLGVEDRFARKARSVDVLRSDPPLQAAIVPVVIGHGRNIMEVAQARSIPLFVLGPFFPSELPDVGGGPRRKFSSWVALFNWAEEEKGYALGRALLDEAERAGAFARDGKIHIIALGGDRIWFGSGLRQAGLARAIAERRNAVLDQLVSTKWTPKEGKELTAKLLRRFPEASVVWAASDQLGAGALEALTELGRVPGKRAFVGGLDLSDLGLRLVNEGKFVATAASTMLSYAQVAVLTYDYLHGRDFAKELGSELSFPTYVATRDNAEQHVRLSRCVASIDFRTFSKVHNKRLKKYDFSLEAFIAASKGCGP